MATKSKPHWDEFLLALFWVVTGAVLLYYGTTGYIFNLSQLANLDLSLPHFIISFGLLSLAVFGLGYAFRVFRRIPRHLPDWLDNLSLLFGGSVLATGFVFTSYTGGLLTYALFTDGHSRFVLAWGVITMICLIVLAIYQLLWAINIFEPFLPWPDEFYNQTPSHKSSLPMRLLLSLNAIQHSLLSRGGKFGYALEKVSGPLLPELDPKTTIAAEKTGERPGLEKSLIAHGGWHANTLGFLANGTTIFAISDGGTVHYQAGGRKGMLFPPEIKLWDVHTDRVQTASLGQPYTFLTRKYMTPAPAQNYRFMVPTGGGKFALITPTLIRVGEWQSSQIQDVTPDQPLVLRGLNGFSTLAFNPEGSKIAWCTAEGQTCYYNLEDHNLQNLRLYPAPDGIQTGQPEGAWGLVFSPDGTKIATIGAQGVLLQNVFTGWRWFAANNPANERLTAFSFNFNGFEMAVGLSVRPEAVRLPNSRRVRSTIPGDQASLASVSASSEAAANQRWVNIIRLWDLRQPDYLDLVLGEQPARELIFSPDNQMLAAVDEAGVLRLWDIAAEGIGGRPPRLVAQLDVGLSGRKTVLAFSPDMQNLICATDNRLLIYNLTRLRKEASPI